MGVYDVLGKILGGGNPADEAMPYMHQAESTQKQYYTPYINMGQEAGGRFSDLSSRYASDPAGVLNELMSSYKPSEGYKFQEERMGQAASNEAAAGGYRGSPRAQFAREKVTQGLLSEDMDKFLRNALGIQEKGMQGEEDLFKTGYGASSSLADNLSNIFGSEGSLAFQGEREKNKRVQDFLGMLTQLAGTAMEDRAKSAGGGA